MSLVINIFMMVTWTSANEKSSSSDAAQSRRSAKGGGDNTKVNFNTSNSLSS